MKPGDLVLIQIPGVTPGVGQVVRVNPDGSIVVQPEKTDMRMVMPVRFLTRWAA